MPPRSRAPLVGVFDLTSSRALFGKAEREAIRARTAQADRDAAIDAFLNYCVSITAAKEYLARELPREAGEQFRKAIEPMQGLSFCREVSNLYKHGAPPKPDSPLERPTIQEFRHADVPIVSGNLDLTNPKFAPALAGDFVEMQLGAETANIAVNNLVLTLKGGENIRIWDVIEQAETVMRAVFQALDANTAQQNHASDAPQR